MARPRGGDWLIDEIKALRESDVNVLVSLLTPAEVSEFDLAEEASFCHTQGSSISPFRFPTVEFPHFPLKRSLSWSSYEPIFLRENILLSIVVKASGELLSLQQVSWCSTISLLSLRSIY
jgi:hypothetical protein